MHTLRLLIDTVAVALGNLLNLNPTGWTASKHEAVEMRARSDASKNRSGLSVEIIDTAGMSQIIHATGTSSPIQYLFKSMASASINLGFIYLGVMLVKAFVATFILLAATALAIVAVVRLVEWISPNDSVPVPAAT
jgi:hypothetical protein